MGNTCGVFASSTGVSRAKSPQAGRSGHRIWIVAQQLVECSRPGRRPARWWPTRRSRSGRTWRSRRWRSWRTGTGWSGWPGREHHAVPSGSGRARCRQERRDLDRRDQQCHSCVEDARQERRWKADRRGTAPELPRRRTRGTRWSWWTAWGSGWPGRSWWWTGWGATRPKWRGSWPRRTASRW